MTAEPRVQIVRLTPAGRAAIATVAVRGTGSAELVDRIFRPASRRPLVKMTPGRIVFGRWGDGDGGEEVVAARLSETNIEIHCHGGAAAVTAIVDSLCRAGGVEVAWENFAGGETGVAEGAGSVKADARRALAAVRTERTAAILLDQYHGALAAELRQIVEAIDRDDIRTTERRLAELLQRASIGLHLTEPWQIALAGPPNVGKSTLINAIVGYERAITYSQPGTTRDVVTATTAIDGWPVELSDTAGLRTTSDPIEAAGVGRAEERLAGAEIALLVFDLAQPWTDEQSALVERWPEAIVVHNKSDVADAMAGDRPDGIVVSAQCGHGIDRLLVMLADRLVPEGLVDGAALPFTGEQVGALHRAQKQLRTDPISAKAQLRMFA